MFTGITNKKKLAELQKNLVEVLNKYKTDELDIKLGHGGGSWNEKVSFSEDLNIWWVLNIASNQKRYWDAFGIGKPSASENIIVEINNPIEGIDFHTAANWAQDEFGHYYLFHSGKIGGGKKGVGQSLFKEKYKGEYFEIFVDGHSRESALVGKLSDENFAYQIAEFVYETARIKGIKIETETQLDEYSFSKEFDGTKEYNLPEKIVANGNHGIIVNELEAVLKTRNIFVGSNGATGRIDLFTYNKKKEILKLLEVKTSLSLQSIYTAIGQLLVYSYPLKPKPELIFVCPSDISEKMGNMLESISITVLRFRWLNNKPVFINLDEIFK